MDKLKPYINNLKYPYTEYVYSPNSDTAIDPTGKPDGDNNIHHIIGSGINSSTNLGDEQKEVFLKDFNFGDVFNYAFGTDGNLYSWGYNQSGSLGTGDFIDYLTPVKVKFPNNLKPIKVSNGYEHSLAITSDGNLYAWGQNGSEQIGNGTRTNVNKPILITLEEGVKPKDIGANGFRSVAIGDNGKVYWWGAQICVSTPTVVELPEGVKATKIYIDDKHQMVIGDDGNLYSWGYNRDGELGIGDIGVESYSPIETINKVQLPIGVKAKEVYLNYSTSFVIGTDGNLYAWGRNTYSQLGVGSTKSKELLPMLVTLANGVKPIKVFTGNSTNMALGDDGNLYGWGSNWNGELGIGKGVNDEETTPQLITLPNSAKSSFASIGYSSTIILDTNGKLYGCGENRYGELGLGNKDIQPNLVELQLPGGIAAKSVSTQCDYYATFVLGSDNYYYSTGHNSDGTLGIGNTVAQTTFQKVEIKK